MSGSRKKKPFYTFLCIWLILLALAVAAGLYSFHSFLLEYEEVYPLSLPETEMDKILAQLSTADTEGVFNLVTALPKPLAGESDEDMEYAFIQFLDKAELKYECSERAEDHVSFTILNGDTPVGSAELRRSPVEQLPYDLPSWYLSTLVFHTIPAAG